MDTHTLFSKKNINLVSVLLVLLSIFFFFKILQSIKEVRTATMPTNQISVSGRGEAFATPDTSEITFSIQKEAKTAKEAQEDVNKRTKDVLAFLKDKNIEDKYIKTINDSFYPQYDYPQIQCITFPCAPVNPVVRGYQVERTFSVKIKNIDDVSAITQGLTERAVTNMSGPNFVVGDEEAVKAEARTQAIIQAKEKATQIAKDLNIDLKKVVSFYEDQPYTPNNQYMAVKAEGAMMSSDATGAAPAPLPQGENKYTSTITITYEIR